MFDRGELAQLARALALQARGQGFDSLILHEVGVSVSVCVKNHPLAAPTVNLNVL